MTREKADEGDSLDPMEPIVEDECSRKYACNVPEFFAQMNLPQGWKCTLITLPNPCQRKNHYNGMCKLKNCVVSSPKDSNGTSTPTTQTSRNITKSPKKIYSTSPKKRHPLLPKKHERFPFLNPWGKAETSAIASTRKSQTTAVPEPTPERHRGNIGNFAAGMIGLGAGLMLLLVIIVVLVVCIIKKRNGRSKKQKLKAKLSIESTISNQYNDGNRQLIKNIDSESKENIYAYCLPIDPYSYAYSHHNSRRFRRFSGSKTPPPLPASLPPSRSTSRTEPVATYINSDQPSALENEENESESRSCVSGSYIDVFPEPQTSGYIDIVPEPQTSGYIDPEQPNSGYIDIIPEPQNAGYIDIIPEPSNQTAEAYNIRNITDPGMYPYSYAYADRTSLSASTQRGRYYSGTLPDPEHQAHSDEVRRGNGLYIPRANTSLRHLTHTNHASHGYRLSTEDGYLMPMRTTFQRENSTSSS